MKWIWKEYFKELREPPLYGPGLKKEWPGWLRWWLHRAFITLRYLSLYFFFKPIAWMIMHSISRFEMSGRENLIREEGFIGTWNHLSNFDPVVGTLFTPVPAYVMTKAEYFKTPVLGGVAGLIGGFPVRRGEADRQAIKTALAVIKRNGLLGIFLEGTRSKTFQLQPAQPGAALLASAQDVAVVPIAITGTENFMRRKKWGFLGRPPVRVVAGPAYNLKQEATMFAARYDLPAMGKRGRHDDLEFLSDILMLKIADILPTEYRGEFTPELIAARYRERVAQKEKATTKSV